MTMRTMTKAEFEELCFKVHPEYREVVKLLRSVGQACGPITMLREVAVFCFENKISNEDTDVLASILKEFNSDIGVSYFKPE